MYVNVLFPNMYLFWTVDDKSFIVRIHVYKSPLGTDMNSYIAWRQ